MPLLHSLSLAELTEACVRMDVPRYRAAQIWRWMYVQMVSGWAEMKNLPADLREKMAVQYPIEAAVALETSGNPADTCKILVGFNDGERAELVLIPASGRLTVCVSSQVGCSYACAFCASGQNGFRRNLDAGEMVGQVLLACRAGGQRVTNVVFMGMGEPFDNYDCVLKAIRILNDKDGLNIGARKITISTCGVIPGIARLAEEGIQVELSVSLHAPTDEIRSRLMPVNRKYPIEDLLRACKSYFEKTRRIITFEYTLIKGVNDTPAQSSGLVRLLSGVPCRVNLIPLSAVDEYVGTASADATCEDFMRVLEKAGINTTLRRSKGGQINAACGQLRFARQAATQP